MGVADAARSSGVIRCHTANPLTPKYIEYMAHDERGVEKMKLTHDDRYLITAGRDGCVLLFDVKDPDTRREVHHSGFNAFADQILVSKTDIDDIKVRTRNLLDL